MGYRQDQLLIADYRLLLQPNGTFHAHYVLTGSIRFIIIEAGENTMGNLLDDQFVVRLALFALPEDPVRVAFHILHITFGTIVLLVRKGYRKTGSYFLSVHSA